MGLRREYFTLKLSLSISVCRNLRLFYAKVYHLLRHSLVFFYLICIQYDRLHIFQPHCYRARAMLGRRKPLRRMGFCVSLMTLQVIVVSS